MHKIASQMGVDPATLGAEAQNIWSMLEDMSQNDPTAYREFIANQMKENAMSSRKRFTPKPGFVVKFAVEVKGAKQKLFINCCCHECIDIPKNPNNRKDVPRDTRSVPNTSNLEIPLAIGELMSRSIQGDLCQVVDAVFHPWVIERAAWDSKFKNDVIQLASTWVEEEKDIILIRPGKIIKSLYKGGIGSGQAVVANDFYVPEDPTDNHLKEELSSSPKLNTALEETKAVPAPSNQQVINNPQELLRRLDDPAKNGDNTSSNQTHKKEEFHLKMPSVAPTTKKLIEVIEPDQPNSTNDINPKKARAAKFAVPIVKKGFLNNNNTNAPLYPKGSTEGRPPSAYVNLLSRSKVVDLTNAQLPTKEPPATVPKTLSKPKVEQTISDYEFEQLCLEAEPELANPKADRGADPFLNEELAQFLLQKI
jgi:hypothetical protein